MAVSTGVKPINTTNLYRLVANTENDFKDKTNLFEIQEVSMNLLIFNDFWRLSKSSYMYSTADHYEYCLSLDSSLILLEIMNTEKTYYTLYQCHQHLKTLY
ncbi:hypothetical protein CHS0354_042908 [Potamilus streckersoni]|uniref:Uncharacterized protein n=1 Tax=Potamilus streckersoni TaxID=2493646 RepID=A0AAE0W6G6_9BIVA|nr:hypothetical protein CHS0354_042908 [Potamilus streckersoni]